MRSSWPGTGARASAAGTFSPAGGGGPGTDAAESPSTTTCSNSCPLASSNAITRTALPAAGGVASSSGSPASATAVA